MRLKKYILNEKVDKKSVESILNSTDVIVGAEFEFIAKFLEDEKEYYDSSNSLYNDARDAYWDYHDTLERISNDENEPPIIPTELIYYDESYKKYKNGDYIPEPNPPSYTDIEDDDEWADFVEKFINDHNPPFKNIKVYSGHAEDKALSNWVAEQDGSLGETGIEIKSPPLTLKEFVNICPKVFDWIDKYGYTDSSCGFHIHMSLKNIPDLVKNLDLVKLTLFTDEEYIWKFFPDRINNTYAISMKKNLEHVGYLDKDDWKQFVDYKKLVNKIGESHYNAINWEGLSDDDQHIEFRYLGDKNYHKMWENIKKIIANYAYNLDLACNTKSHMKEYANKIKRIINKLDMIKYETIIVELKDWRNIEIEKWTTHDSVDIRTIIDKYIKKYENIYNSMSSIYKKPLYTNSMIDVSSDLNKIRKELFETYNKMGGILKKKTINKMFWVG